MGVGWGGVGVWVKPSSENFEQRRNERIERAGMRREEGGSLRGV